MPLNKVFLRPQNWSGLKPKTPLLKHYYRRQGISKRPRHSKNEGHSEALRRSNSLSLACCRSISSTVESLG